MAAVRVRFAPSPTGPLHMGGVRTALYNYLFAKHHGGTFIVRIEDTDQKRYVAGAEDYIFKALKWCGIEPDESPLHGGDFGPYRQSERKPEYASYVQTLLDKGFAYKAFDTSEELDTMRALAKKSGKGSWQYDTLTRSSMKNELTLSSQEVEERIARKEPYVIRVKMPRNTEIKFQDAIRGWVSVNTNHLDDKVLVKADGMPTYHMANIIDDMRMEISHVIRGEEWLPSAPLHQFLYQCFEWQAPTFAHLPLILKPDGNGKLSKRDGDRLGFPVFPLNWTNPETEEQSEGYLERGFFPEAFINMLAFLGWNPGDEREIFSLEDLSKEFSLEKVGKAGAKFDFEKAKWYNQQYLRNTPSNELAERLSELLPQVMNKSLLASVCELMKERAYTVYDIVRESTYFFEAPSSYHEKTVAKKWNANSKMLLVALESKLNALEPFTAESIEQTFKSFLEEQSTGFGKAMPPFRLAVTGLGTGPSMNDICAILGKVEVLSRIKTALSVLPNPEK